jgi:phosphoglycolate phosphatase-like HAD superfamily hydrolase
MFERILVPLDGSARAEMILPQIARILNREDAEILLLRVVNIPDSAGLVMKTTIRHQEREEGQQYLHDMALRFTEKSSKVHARLAEGWPADVILETAKSEGATMIAMTTHGRSGMARWALGSVAEKVARASDVPVLLLRSFRRSPQGDLEPMASGDPPFRRILVPVDGSPTSMSVIGPAEKVAELYGSEVLVLHVVPPYAPPGAMLPGMEAALDTLAARGCRFAVCTNKLERLSVLLLERLGLAHRFAFICGQDTFGMQKPDPEVLRRTVAAAGGSLQNTIMIGDSINDIRVARSAGVPVIAVDFGYTERPVSELGPDRVIGDFSQLPAAVAELCVAN